MKECGKMGQVTKEIELNKEEAEENYIVKL